MVDPQSFMEVKFFSSLVLKLKATQEVWYLHLDFIFPLLMIGKSWDTQIHLEISLKQFSN